MVRAFREFRSERKKRTTSGGCPQFPTDFASLNCHTIIKTIQQIKSRIKEIKEDEY